jgi:hypothetical protein
MADRDLTALEKAAGKKAARTIQRNLKTILATATVKQSGVLLKNSHAKPVMMFDALESIAINTTSVGMKLNYGYERIYTNGLAMSKKTHVQEPTNHIYETIKKSNGAIKRLAEEIAEIRGSSITAKIQEVLKFEEQEAKNI